jgi:hypothetical protein
MAVGATGPMGGGSGLGNSKAQSDCLKLMLPLQTPLGHQSRLLCAPSPY